MRKRSSKLLHRFIPTFLSVVLGLSSIPVHAQNYEIDLTENEEIVTEDSFFQDDTGNESDFFEDNGQINQDSNTVIDFDETQIEHAVDQTQTQKDGAETVIDLTRGPRALIMPGHVIQGGDASSFASGARLSTITLKSPEYVSLSSSYSSFDFSCENNDWELDINPDDGSTFVVHLSSPLSGKETKTFQDGVDILFHDAAVLQDGSIADVRMKIGNATIKHTAGVSGNQYLTVTGSTVSVGKGTSGTGAIGAAIEYHVIIEKNGKPVDGEFWYSMAGIGSSDKTASGSFDGEYSESIIFHDGPTSDFYTPENSTLNFSGGSDVMQIKGTTEDGYGYESGFLVLTGPDLIFNWQGSAAYGSSLSANLFNSVPVIKASTSVGGNIDVDDETGNYCSDSFTGQNILGVPNGKDVLYTMTPMPGYELKDVIVDGAYVTDEVKQGYASSGEYTYLFKNVQESHMINVTWSGPLAVYTRITNGTITPGSRVEPGDDVSIRYNANDGYIIDKIYEDGNAVDPNSASYYLGHTFYDIQESHRLEVVCRERKATDSKLHTISTHVVNGQITGEQTVQEGDDVTIEYSSYAPQYYYLDSLMVDGQLVDIMKEHSAQYTFEDVREDHEIVAVFMPYFTITTSVENGTITESAEDLRYNDTRTINYSPNPGCTLKSVMVDDKDISITQYPDSYTFENVDDNHSIAVVYEKGNFQITTAVANGTITPSLTAEGGSTVDIEFAPRSGYELESITIDGTKQKISGSEKKITFEALSSAHDVRVTFKPISHKITTSAVHGTITPGTEVGENGLVIIELAPEDGYYLTGLSINGVQQDVSGKLTDGDGYKIGIASIKTYSQDMFDKYAKSLESFEIKDITKDIAVTAEFSIKTFNINTHVTNGTISDAIDNIPYGESRTITYAPNPGYKLQQITVNGMAIVPAEGDDTTQGGSYEFKNITRNYTIGVMYAPIAYSISTSASNGTITESKGDLTYGSEYVVSYSPKEGYSLASVTVDGAAVDINKYPESYTFSGINVNHTIRVEFKKEACSIVTGALHGSITPGMAVDYGSDYTVEYAAEPGYKLAKLVVDGKEVNVDDYPDKYEFKNITTSHTISAEYEEEFYKVTTSAENGTISKGETVGYGYRFMVELSPNEGYYLESLSINGVQQNLTERFKDGNGYKIGEFTMHDSIDLFDQYGKYPEKFELTDISKDIDVKAEFAIKTYKINTHVENGTISESIKDIPYGETRTISYSPKAGYQFKEMTVNGALIIPGPDDDLTAPGSYKFENISRNFTISVYYEPSSYRVETEATGGQITEGQSLEYDGSMSIRLTPDEGRYLSSLSINGVQQDLSGKFTEGDGYKIGHVSIHQNTGDMFDRYGEYLEAFELTHVTKNVKVEAEFSVKTFHINTNVENGTITNSIEDIPYGETRTVTYAPKEGYKLRMMTVNGAMMLPEPGKDITTEESYKFENIKRDFTISVYYEPIRFSVETSAAHGTITPSSSGIAYGSDLTISYSPEDGYKLAGITVDDTPVDISAYPDSYEFKNITGGHKIHVEFEPMGHVISTNVSGGTITKGSVAEHGTDMSISYEPNSGYKLARVEVDGNPVDINEYPSSYEFKNIEEDHTISVTYEPIGFEVATSAEHGTITPGNGDIKQGESMKVEYTPEEGYKLASIEVDGAQVNIEEFGSSYEFTDIAENHTIHVVYVPIGYTISTSAQNGTITPESNVEYGSNFSVQYSANDGYMLSLVEVDGQPIDISAYPGSYDFYNITADHVIRVVYEKAEEPKPQTWTIRTITEHGTITPESTVNNNDSAEVQFRADEGYYLTGLKINGTQQDNITDKLPDGDVYKIDYCDFTVEQDPFTHKEQNVMSAVGFKDITGDITVEPVFAIKKFSITTHAENGTISESITDIPYGEDRTIRYSPNPGYKFKSLVINDGAAGEIIAQPTDEILSEYTHDFGNIMQDFDVVVVFEPITYEITTGVTGGTISPSANAKYGDSITVSYSPDEGYVLTGITVDGFPVDISLYPDSYEFGNIQENHKIRVVFEKEKEPDPEPKPEITKYRIDTQAEHGEITPGSDVEEGKNLVISYKANDGYYLSQLIVDGTQINIEEHPESYEFKDIKSAHSIHAVYEPYFKITTEVTGGTITKDIEKIKKADKKTVQFEPDENGILAQIIVDGVEKDFEKNQKEFVFENIDADHHIKVVYISRPVLSAAKDDKEIDGNKVELGDNGEVTYRIKWTNPTDKPMTVTITDVLPEGAELVSSDDAYYEDGKLTWMINLDGNETFSLAFTVKFTGKRSGTVKNSVTIENEKFGAVSSESELELIENKQDQKEDPKEDKKEDQKSDEKKNDGKKTEEKKNNTASSGSGSSSNQSNSSGSSSSGQQASSQQSTTQTVTQAPVTSQNATVQQAPAQTVITQHPVQTVIVNRNTGDESHVAIWFAGIAAAAFVLFGLKKKKQKI